MPLLTAILTGLACALVTLGLPWLIGQCCRLGHGETPQAAALGEIRWPLPEED